MPAESVGFESVTARDIALVVLEELSLSDPFRSWLLEAIGLEVEDESVTDLEARDSLGATGSTDFDAARGRSASALEIDLELEDSDERVSLILTVATDRGSSAAADALERIRTRRDRALEGRWDDCRVVLFAPTAGLEESATADEPTIDATVPLESLRDRLAARGTDRGAYRATLLATAIDGGRDRDSAGGPPAVVDAYRSLATEREPAFEFRAGSDLDLETVGDGVSVDDSTVAIDAPSLADDHLLVHALADGTVDLRIPGAADRLRTFVARHASALSTATTPLADGDALVLRRSVPALDSVGGPDDAGAVPDGDAFDDALEAVRDLIAVSERVRDEGS